MGNSSERISKALYVWGQFEDLSLQELTTLKYNINQKLNGPNFEPHLTLSGPILDSTIGVDSCLSKHLESYSRIVLNVDGFGIKKEFFQSLFLKVEKNNSLLNLKKNLDIWLELESENFFPHISMFYGNIEESKKQRSIRSFLSPNEVVMSKISIVDVNEHINQWKVIKTYNLK